MLTLGIKVPAFNIESEIDKLHRCCALVQSIGFSAIEFSPDSFDLIECGVIDENNTGVLRTVLDQYPFEKSIHIPLRCNLFNSRHADLHEQVFLASLQLCRELDAKILVHHPGRSHDNVDFPRLGKPHHDLTFSREWIEREMEIIRKAADLFPDITIALENHRSYADFSPYSYAEFCEHLADVVHQINKPNVGVTIDTGHLNIASAFHHLNLHEELFFVREYAVHCHIHDNHGIANFYTDKDKAAMLPFGLGDEHMVPGRGTFPFPEFFKLMNNFKGTYVIELTSRYFYEHRMREAYNAVHSFHTVATTGEQQS